MNTYLLEQYKSQLKEDTANYQRIKAENNIAGWCYYSLRPQYFYEPNDNRIVSLKDDSEVIKYIACLIESGNVYLVGRDINPKWFRQLNETQDQYIERVTFEHSQYRRTKLKELGWIIELSQLEQNIKVLKKQISELYANAKSE